MKVKVLKCDYEEFVGKVVNTYCVFPNGVSFLTRFGLVIYLKKGDYEVVSKGKD